MNQTTNSLFLHLIHSIKADTYDLPFHHSRTHRRVSGICPLPSTHQERQ